LTVGHGYFGAFCVAVLTNAQKLSWLLPSGGFRRSLNRRRRERGAMTIDYAKESVFLDRVFGPTLARLGSFQVSLPSWHRVIVEVEANYLLLHAGADPHFLRMESVRDWLRDTQVCADLKTLAMERLGGIATDAETTRRRLAQSYAKYTFDDPVLAATPIETAIAGLVAGALSSFSEAERLILGLMRESNSKSFQLQSEILAAITRLECELASGSYDAA
jgi:hypothetical protein